MNSHNLSNYIVSNRLSRTVRSHLTPTLIKTVGSELSYTNLLNLIDKGAVPADIALRSGTEFVIGDYGVLGFAMKSAATLAQAVQRSTIKLQALSCQCAFDMNLPTS